MKILDVIQLTFDNMENEAANAIGREILVTLVGENIHECRQKLDKWLRDKYEPVRLYRGWDGELYPQIILRDRDAV